MNIGVIMKHFTLFCMLFVSTTLLAQKQYFLPTGDNSMDEKERPLIEVYLPKQELANGLIFENTDVQGFAKLVADTNVVVLDVRTASEFAEGHLERAINIDYHQGDFVEKARATLPIDKKIAVYCRSGRRSAGAAAKLCDEGYKLVNLKGGIIAWKEADMPVITK